MQIRDKYLSGGNDVELEREINFAINNIAERRIYHTSIVVSDNGSPKLKQKK